MLFSPMVYSCPECPGISSTLVGQGVGLRQSRTSKEILPFLSPLSPSHNGRGGKGGEGVKAKKSYNPYHWVTLA